jgi:hypothetical protein
MSHFLTRCLQVLSRPANVAGESVSTARRVDGRDLSTRAEQLEEIAVYARAGYFDRSCPGDGYETPLH